MGYKFKKDLVQMLIFTSSIEKEINEWMNLVLKQ